MKRAVLLIASVGYVGYIPVASGTFGTAAALPLVYVFHLLASTSAALAIALFVALVAFACWVAGRADEILQEHDSHKIVIDEAAGYVAAALFLPFSWTTAIMAFLVFRVFDVIKPFPAGYIDANVPGGAGVVLDDVVSGIYTNILLQILLRLGYMA